MTSSSPKVAILWRGDEAARRNATPENNRYHRVFDELAALGISAEPAVYDEAFADEVREQLLEVDAVLVWVNPLQDGKTREQLDLLLREVADRGPWVSAHPDAILKMGVKEVLVWTKHLGWGSDTEVYRAPHLFHADFPPRLRAAGPRVLKRNRGNAGQGVWKVRDVGGGQVEVLEAASGSVPEVLGLADFMTRCDPYFAYGGCIVDQPFQERLPEGMIRCYMGTDKVVGFGHQLIKALIPPPPEGPDSAAAQPGPRIMHPAWAEPFQALRRRMETEWTPMMMEVLGLQRADLPIIWDADFLLGPKTPTGEDTYVLCEINVSSVFAIPDQAPAEIARLTAERLRDRGGRSRHV